MKTRAQLHPYLLPAIVGLAITLFSIVGVARVVGWAPESTGAPVTASGTRDGPRCPECGMIVSTRVIDEHQEGADPGISDGTLARYQDASLPKAARRYEMTVRMADGTSRVIHHTGPAGWRAGERLIVIDGARPSHQ